MNFTLLAQQYTNQNDNKMSPNVTLKHKIIIDNDVEYLVCPDGKRFAIWSLIEPLKTSS